MPVNAQFLRSVDSNALRAGEARVLRVTGLYGGDTFVFLDAGDNVSRVSRADGDSTVVPWEVEQVLRDVLDPHSASVE